MQLQVKGKNLEVTESIRTYTERKLQKLDRRVQSRPVEIDSRSRRTRPSPTRRSPRRPSTSRAACCERARPRPT